MKNTKKTANKLPVPGKVKKGFRSSPTIPASAATAFSPLRAALSLPLPKKFST